MMQPVRVVLALLLATSLGGCSGFSIGVRQDKEDREHLAGVLARAPTGRPFAARALLDRPFRRLWVFRGGGDTQAVEDRIGIPFPQSGEAIPAGSAYLVFDDGEQVLSAFSFAGAVDATGATGRCLLAERAPLAPGTEVVGVRTRRGGVVEPSPVAAAEGCR